MFTAHATIETERASRYLVQLCEHVGHLARMPGATDAEVEHSDSQAMIRVGAASCKLDARPDALALCAEAPDVSGLARLTDRVGGRLEQIGRRDALRVVWRSTSDIPAAPTPDQRRHDPGAHEHD